jgi:hypothetical protein
MKNNQNDHKGQGTPNDQRTNTTNTTGNANKPGTTTTPTDKKPATHGKAEDAKTLSGKKNQEPQADQEDTTTQE